MWHLRAGMSKWPVCGHRCLLIGFLTKSSNGTRPISSEEQSHVFYVELGGHVCWPDWDLRLSQQVVFGLHLSGQSRSVLSGAKSPYNQLQDYYRGRLPENDTCGGGSQQAGQALCAGSLSVCSSSVLHSFSPTLLLSQLAEAEAVDENHCFGYRGAKGVDGWVPTLAKWDLENGLWDCFKVKVQMAEHVGSGWTEW